MIQLPTCQKWQHHQSISILSFASYWSSLIFELPLPTSKTKEQIKESFDQ
jgi:hypothetical protein